MQGPDHGFKAPRNLFRIRSTFEPGRERYTGLGHNDQIARFTGHLGSGVGRTHARRCRTIGRIVRIQGRQDL